MQHFRWPGVPTAIASPTAGILAILLVSYALPLLAGQTKPNLRKLLAKMQSGPVDTKHLARAFSIGDANIDELISALDDRDESVSLNAQIVIRYLGNQDGMTALFHRYASGQIKATTGAVPVPLSDWDFNQIESRFLCAECRLEGWGVPEYTYALMLDSSPRATQTLDRLVQKFNPEWLPTTKTDGRFANVEPIAPELLREAFWLTATEKKVTTAKLISVTTDSRKALFEVYVNQGALAEKWFNVVAVREAAGWKIISVTMSGQS